MKKTAVEYLVDELLSGKLLMPSLIQQAKEMEKQQIINAFTVGNRNEKYQFETSEQYYNETYNK